jgi:hypothetical protein
MSVNAYSLTSPVFGSMQDRHVPARARPLAESCRYLILRLVGCWHRSMTRPFTQGGSTYRACTVCGMRREFDPETWRMKGRYYSGPAGSAMLIDSGAGELGGLWPGLSSVRREKNAGEGTFGGVIAQELLPDSRVQTELEILQPTMSPHAASVTMSFFDAGPSPVNTSPMGIRQSDETRVRRLPMQVRRRDRRSRRAH